VLSFRGRTPSLPSYHSEAGGSSEGEAPPPCYEEELAGEIAVVNGFQYTPSATGSTPDSSVVNYSPRLSVETRETRFSGKEDSSSGSELDLDD